MRGAHYALALVYHPDMMPKSQDLERPQPCETTIYKPTLRFAITCFVDISAILTFSVAIVDSHAQGW